MSLCSAAWMESLLKPYLTSEEFTRWLAFVNIYSPLSQGILSYLFLNMTALIGSEHLLRLLVVAVWLLPICYSLKFYCIWIGWLPVIWDWDWYHLSCHAIVQIKPAEYMEMISSMKPDISVSLADEVPSWVSSKRNKASVDRTLRWLDDCISLNVVIHIFPFESRWMNKYIKIQLVTNAVGWIIVLFLE